MDPSLYLKPCIGCHKRKVFHPGDYCKDCAIKWVSGDSYFVVTTSSIGDIMEATGIDGSYLKAKSDLAFEKHCAYVVYHTNGEWKDITVSDGFHLPTIMRRLFEREEKSEQPKETT